MSDLAEFLLARIAEDEQYEQSPHADHNEHTYLRAMAEREAKRRIVELHHTAGRSGLCDECHSKVWPCPTLRLLALPYADHPDYREEWRP